MVKVAAANSTDVEQAVSCLASAFSRDPITGYLLNTGDGYPQRVSKFFSLLMRARIAIDMPVLVARADSGICGASMGYATTHPDWPKDITEEWDRFERGIPGFTDRMSVYDDVATQFKPKLPHYYLGVIGTDPARHGSGIGSKLINAFCEKSANDPASSGVYLETAQESNLRFYERAGFAETGRGKLGDATLWCMFLSHERG